MRAHRIFLGGAIALLVIGLLAPEVALATNGYFMHGVGTRSKGLAGAGVAFPQDALAAGSNPAGMAFVGKRYDAGLAIFNPNREYTVSGAPSGFPGTFGLIPGTVESDSNYFPVPNFGANWELSSGAALGLSIYGQGGMNTDWPTATFYDPTSSSTGVDLSQLFVVPTWAQSYGGGRHAIGISPILAYQMFEIEGVLSFGPFSSDPSNLSGNGTESSAGFGFKVGYLGQLTRAVTFGASYQSEISMDEFGDYAGLFAEQGGFDIPSTWTAGFAYRFGDRGAFLLDYQEISYSDAASVSNPFLPNLAQARLGDDGGAGFGWQDMEVVKVGYQWGSGAWTWRLGFSTTDQPIPPSEVLFNILAPGVMEEHFTFGFTKAMGNGREFNFALMHAPAVSVSGANPLEAPGLQTIELEMDQWDLEIGFTWGR